MKIKRFFLYIMMLGGIVILFSSCTNGFEDVNKNPNDPDITNPEYLFNSSVYYTVETFNGEIKKRLFGNYVQYHWGMSDQMGRYGNYPGSNNNYWRNAFNNAAFPVRYIQNTEKGNPEYHNRILIAKIWENYIFSQIVAIWGHVPMQHSMKGSQAVPYDREETIYYTILENLKDCVVQINLDGDKFSTDPVFPSASDKSSDLVKWVKFANSIRLRLAVRISNDAPNGNPQKAREVIGELLQDPEMLINSKEDECKAKWGNTPATRNYFYNYLVVEKEANKDKLNTAGEAILQHMAPYNDPRVEKFFTKADPSHVPLNFPWAPYWGEPKNSNTPPGVSLSDNPHRGKTSENYSMMHETFFTPDYEEMLFSYSEICFLLCEITYRGLGTGVKTAEEYYYDGIRESMSRFDVTPSEVDNYLTTPGIEWGTLSDLSDGEDKFKDWTGITSSAIKADEPDPIYRQIVMQQYIGLFYQSLEAWNLIRRTQILDFVPHFSPDTGNGAEVSPNKTFAYIPQRLVYPDNEITNNTKEVNKAIEWMDGGNKMSTKLWFAKPTKTNTILEFN